MYKTHHNTEIRHAEVHHARLRQGFQEGHDQRRNEPHQAHRNEGTRPHQPVVLRPGTHRRPPDAQDASLQGFRQPRRHAPLPRLNNDSRPAHAIFA